MLRIETIKRGGKFRPSNDLPTVVIMPECDWHPAKPSASPRSGMLARGRARNIKSLPSTGPPQASRSRPARASW